MCIVVVPKIKRLLVYLCVHFGSWRQMKSATNKKWAVSECGRSGIRTSVSGGGRGVGGASGSTDLLFLSTVKRCRTLCGPFHDDSSGEIPIIYGYFAPNPEKYWPVKGMVLTLCLSRAYMFWKPFDIIKVKKRIKNKRQPIVRGRI